MSLHPGDQHSIGYVVLPELAHAARGLCGRLGLGKLGL